MEADHVPRLDIDSGEEDSEDHAKVEQPKALLDLRSLGVLQLLELTATAYVNEISRLGEQLKSGGNVDASGAIQTCVLAGSAIQFPLFPGRPGKPTVKEDGLAAANGEQDGGGRVSALASLESVTSDLVLTTSSEVKPITATGSVTHEVAPPLFQTPTDQTLPPRPSMLAIPEAVRTSQLSFMSYPMAGMFSDTIVQVGDSPRGGNEAPRASNVTRCTTDNESTLKARTNASQYHHSTTTAKKSMSMHQHAVLNPMWLIYRGGTDAARGTSRLPPRKTEQRDEPINPEDNKPKTCLQRVVSSQSMSRRFFWGVFGLIAVGWALFAVPFEVFNPPQTAASSVLHAALTVYWTMDMGIHLTSSYITPEGREERRISVIMLQYLQGWFWIDAPLLALDYVTILTDAGFEELAVLRMSKSMRLLKVVKILRLVRVLKVEGIVADILELVASDIAATLARVVGLMVMILTSCHFIGCGWYGLTTIAPDRSKTWVGVHLNEALEKNDILYLYITSMHWSLTQFTPASMEVHPHSTVERAYNIIVLLCGMLAFTTMISSISAAMAHIQKLRSEKTTGESMLRGWLSNNRINPNLVARVWTCIKAANRKKVHVPQSDVVLLRKLPHHLVADLMQEIYQPIFEKHPFFDVYMTHNSAGMRRLFDGAVTESWLCAGEELFHKGHTAERAYHVFNGRFLYGASQAEADRLLAAISRQFGGGPKRLLRCSSRILGNMGADSSVSPGDWVSEVALWARYIYRATLIATEYCHLMVIEAKNFQEVMSNYCAQDPMLGRYAELYVRRSSHEAERQDVYYDDEQVEDLAWCAFHCDDFMGAADINPDMFDNDDELSRYWMPTVELAEAAQESRKQATAVRRPSEGSDAASVYQRSEIQAWHDRIRDLRARDEADEDEHGGGGRLSMFSGTPAGFAWVPSMLSIAPGSSRGGGESRVSAKFTSRSQNRKRQSKLSRSSTRDFGGAAIGLARSLKSFAPTRRPGSVVGKFLSGLSRKSTTNPRIVHPGGEMSSVTPLA
eukprot:TRINITY_DN4765_c0_g2_i1.p1 TRINITY_DN4765_c0_g2~~TRINITY_DN4765_c0_g2_i1.p1  ORF type:complete len:1020 (+),score=190.61 TRINITY_DN4765_c0_g2_i1:93-3152(+)